MQVLLESWGCEAVTAVDADAAPGEDRRPQRRLEIYLLIDLHLVTISRTD